MDDLTRRLSALSRDRLLLLCAELTARLDRVEAAGRQPVAIVGMACRFPGGAVDLASYWRLLHDGVDAITEVPPDRWDVDAFYDPDPDAPGKAYARVGGHLADVDRFDPYFFNISPREAVSLDPQYRLLLEVAWEALEDAGQNPHALRGTRTGVFVGVGADDYAKIQLRSAEPESITAYTGTGNAYCYGVGRLSYFLGLQGPNFPVDTACSSSLVVTHLACRSLRTGECDLALAGGVHLMLSPIGSIFLSKERALSPTGRCRTFDAGADGFTRGEGCGIVVLKRLADAIADGDRIHGIVRGSAINHDGPSSGFTVPNGLAQQAVIQAALRDAGVAPADVGYVEAHGTGTPLGDPIEVRALAATLGRRAGRPADRPLAIGSVKANVGHLEPAAGVAGLIKTVLALQHEEIPPQLHLRQVNREIALDDGPFTIATRPSPWPRGAAPRVAGVSSFGLSGTNAHVVVEEAPPTAARVAAPGRPLHVLTLSARTETALRALALRFERHLAADPGLSLADACFTANTGRAHFAHRLAVVAGATHEACDGLRAFARPSDEPTTVLAGRVETGARPRVAFLFTGDGQEHVGMGRHLHDAEPVYRDAIAECDAALAGELGHPLAALLYAHPDGSRLLADPASAHAALFAVEYALLQLWRSWGVEPGAVLGHGVGEYVAATAAGVLGPADALRLVVGRARAAPALAADGRRRAALTTKTGDVRPVVAALPDAVTVLALDSPRRAVVAAPGPVLDELRERLAPQGVRVRPGADGPALGDPAAVAACEWLRAAVPDVRCRAPQIPMISGTTGARLGADTDWTAHWAAHACRPVRFAAAIDALRGRHRHFLELGPAPLLSAWGSQCVPSPGLAWLPSLRPEHDWSPILTSLATLHVHGVPVRWSAVDRPYDRRKVALPSYPFERERFWLDTPRPRRAPALVAEVDALADPATRTTVERLLRAWGDDGAQAVNRMVSAPLLFFASTGQSFFYVNRKGSSMVTVAFVGPPASYEATARELAAYAREEGLTLVVIAQQAHADRLRTLGFARSPVGVWQSIADLQAFSLQAPGMRRLRSKVAAYAGRGDCRTEEHRVGSDAALDRRFVELMEQWVARKRRKAPFVSLLRELVLSGRLPPKYRTFVTRRGDAIDCVVLLAPIESRNGYLLDLEFYPAEMPQGCLEFSIVRTIEQLKGEGIAYYSLGATYGTQIDADPDEDPRIRDLLQAFHREGILNEDGIFEFKRKFQPETVGVYVCTLPDTDLAAVPDTLLMLAAPDTLARPAGRAPSPSPSPSPSDAPTPDAAGHPLLGRRIPLAARAAVFQSTLRIEAPEAAWLADHRVLDTVVLPAAAYVELALAAAGAVLVDAPGALEAVSLVEALPLDRRPRILQVALERGEGRGATVGVWSHDGRPAAGDAGWTLHATARVAPPGDGDPPGRDGEPPPTLADVRRRGLPAADAADYYAQVADFGLHYGPRFRVIEALWSGHGEALARIRLPGALAADRGPYHVHPVLLDGCLQVQGASLLASRTGREPAAMYLPVAIARVELAPHADTALWVYSRLRPDPDGRGEQIVGDVHAWDESGARVGRLEGVAVRRTSADVLRQLLETGERPAEVVCRVEWRSRPRELGGRVAGPGLGWMVFADAGGTGDRLAEQVRARGDRCLIVRAGATFDAGDPARWCVDPGEPEHFRRALAEASPLDRVVYAWSADAAPPEALDAAALRRAQRAGCLGLLHTVQALARREGAGPNPRLWIVTRGAQAVADDPARPNPAQAPVWGLGRTIAHEHPDCWGGMVDLDPDPSPADAAHLLSEIADPDDEDHVAYGGGTRYVARLVADGAPAATPPLRLRPDATYLVTGGAGGLGRVVARWMAGRGAGHLVLAGRAPIAGDVGALLAELERAGVRTARYEQADVSQEADVARVLARIDETLPPLRGVVHTAGVLADATLLQQSWPRFLEVMAPKVDGSWHLHRHTTARALDHFVLFASSAAILGAPGQGNYAAANAFLGALARHRHARGLPAVCIDWGPWGEVGMSAALDPRVRAQRARQGIHALPPPAALRLLEQAMVGSRPEVGILAVDWPALLASAAPALRRSSVLRDLAAAAPAPAPGASDAPDAARAAASAVVRRFAAAAPEQRRAIVEAYVLEQVTRLLGTDERRLDPLEALTAQGFDSLMALELRERVETELQVSMPILTFFRSNSIGGLTTYLLGELASRHGGDAGAPAEEPSPAELLAQLPTLSDAEVDAALRRELER